MGQTCSTNAAVTPVRRNTQVIENIQPQVEKCIKVTRESPQYVCLIQGFNMRFLASVCEVIYLPSNDDEVMEALCEILKNDQFRENFSIASGGHCYENLVYNNKILAIIDISLMDQVKSSDNQGEVEYIAEAGGSNWLLLIQLYRKFGRIIPGGSCYSVGLGGHICGGGYGLLSRRDGLTIDYLSGVDILCVLDNKDKKGEVCLKKIRSDSTDDDERLLLWACKGGGGGNFGLITRYYFKDLPTAPQYAYIETFSIDWAQLSGHKDKFKLLLKAFWDFVDNNEPYFIILSLMHISAGEIPITFQSVFDVEEQSHVEDITAFKTKLLEKYGIQVKSLAIPVVGHPSTKGVLSVAQKLNWYEAAQTLNGSGPNQCGKYKSSYMQKPFPDHQCEALFRFLTMDMNGISKLAKDNPDSSNPKYFELVQELSLEKQDIINFTSSLVQVDSYGVKINTVPPNATAIPQRSSIMKLQYQTYWIHDPNKPNAPELDQFQDWIHRLWVDSMYADVYIETGRLPDPYYEAKSPIQEENGARPLHGLMPVSSCYNPIITPNVNRVVDGCYYNYIDVDLVNVVIREYNATQQQAQDAVLRLYFEGNLENLVKAKNVWDPLNIFKHDLSIPLKLSEPL